MQASSLKALFTDDEGVSPVIGVILMVAVTVILAAVIASFVMNMGGSLSESAPQANFDYDYDADSQTLNITHDSGDSFTNENTDSLDVKIGSERFTWANGSASAAAEFDITAGSEITINVDGTTSGTEDVNTENSHGSGTEVRVIWTANDGSSSQTVSQYTL
ncbi:type IV pilin N-terminal domain-containing protein [Salinibaculum rarum]|uniref:type IV pilin N-terminal domain-containing protein n=1 Tax=Salinibaculum rarum TaxID=3058903 RepID=UPI00265FFA02|nr:type IV pilin N-terminal domain-containing protein [Salinibaculum sp. KK48]